MLICSIMPIRIDAVLSVTNAPTFRSVLLSQSAASVHFCQSTRRHNPEDSCFRKMRLLNLTRFCVQERKFITSDCLLSNTAVESFQIRMSHTQNEMHCPYTLSRCFVSAHMLEDSSGREACLKGQS
jgi:hypothetical protein